MGDDQAERGIAGRRELGPQPERASTLGCAGPPVAASGRPGHPGGGRTAGPVGARGSVRARVGRTGRRRSDRSRPARPGRAACSDRSRRHRPGRLARTRRSRARVVGRRRCRGRVVQGGGSGWAGRGGDRVDDTSAAGLAGLPASRDRGRFATLPRWPDPSDARPTRGRSCTAELLSIGTELTVGETRDTNAGELARALTAHGVEVRPADGPPRPRSTTCATAFVDGLERADLVVSTGGLGPTPGRPDPRGDRGRLRRDAGRSTRRSRPGCASSGGAATCRSRSCNLKQAWLIPSAEALPNPNGTAPGWFVRHGPTAGDRRAARSAARDAADVGRRGRCRASRRPASGRDVACRTYRLTGIGESQVADRARRGAAAGDRTRSSRRTPGSRPSTSGSRRSATARPSAAALVEAAAAGVLDAVGDFVWATGETTWSEAIGDTARGRSAGRSRSSRSGRPASSPRCSATCRGSASTRRSPPTHPEPWPTARPDERRPGRRRR